MGLFLCVLCVGGGVGLYSPVGEAISAQGSKMRGAPFGLGSPPERSWQPAAFQHQGKRLGRDFPCSQLHLGWFEFLKSTTAIFILF